MNSFLSATYNQIKAYDVYANGRISVFVSLYVYIVLAILNLFNFNFSINQTFFFIVPVISAVGAAHLPNINSIVMRNRSYMVFLVFVSCGVCGFTLIEKYNTVALLIFSFLFYLALMNITSFATFAAFRGLIPPVFVLSFLTILVGGAGQFYVMLNRMTSIVVAGIVGYYLLQLVPVYYYRKIWFSSVGVVIARIVSQLHLVVVKNSEEMVFHGDCVNKMNASLAFCQKSAEYSDYQACTTSVYQFYFGVAFTYNHFSKYNRNGCLSNLCNLMHEINPCFSKRTIIPEALIQQITMHQYTAPNNDIRQLWQLLLNISTLWNRLCILNR